MSGSSSDAYAFDRAMQKSEMVTIKRLKGRKRRSEAAVKKDVRAEVFERDSDCRVVGMAPAECLGRHQWAHLKPRTRAQTRGMAPEFRHTTAFTVRMCELHHGAYDAGKFDIGFLTDRYADGPIEVQRR